MVEDNALIDLDLETEAGVVTIRPRGEIDMNTSPSLRDQLRILADRQTAKTIFDLSAVTHLDSSGVGTLVEFKRDVNAYGGEIILAGLQAVVRGMFELTKLDRFFAIFADANEARNALNGSSRSPRDGTSSASLGDR